MSEPYSERDAEIMVLTMEAFPSIGQKYHAAIRKLRLAGASYDEARVTMSDVFQKRAKGFQPEEVYIAWCEAWFDAWWNMALPIEN